MAQLIAIIIKEFQVLLKDPRSRFVIIGPPLIQLIVFGYAATYDVTDIPFAVYNESTDAASRELVARFAGSPNFRQVATLTHESEIQPLIDDRTVLFVLHLPQRFGRTLRLGKQASVQMVLDGRESNTALITLGYAQTIAGRFSNDWARRNGLPEAPARLEVRSWFNPNLQSRWFIVPGIIGLLTLVVTMLVTALSVAREREQGTFDQLLVTPYRPWEILLGKAIPGFIIGLIEATLIIFATVYWFQVPLLGNIATLYLGTMLFLLSAIGIGLMISSISVTQQQGLLGAFLFLVPAIILSGFSTPIANMPVAIQNLTLLNPMRYYMVILRSIFLQDVPFSLLINQLWPLAVIGVFTLTLSAWMFNRR